MPIEVPADTQTQQAFFAGNLYFCGQEAIARELSITHLYVLQDPFAARSRLLPEMRHANLWVG
jgi:hypothetical protein